MTCVTALTRSAAETLAVAEAVGALLRPGDVVVLAGDLGTGKTTFARGVARSLGVTGPVVSPTFTIVREYEGRVRLLHVDVYRLERIQDLHDVGFEEMVGDDAVTLVEWGDVVAALLPRERLEVRLAAGAGDDDRVVTLVPQGPSWLVRADALATVGA
jgi:tRNA threonylcarbamoyladenosine biosynthesis protein TsaE